MHVSAVCLNVHVYACSCTLDIVQTCHKEPEPMRYICYSGLPRQMKDKKKMFPELKSVLVEENAV